MIQQVGETLPTHFLNISALLNQITLCILQEPNAMTDTHYFNAKCLGAWILDFAPFRQ